MLAWFNPEAERASLSRCADPRSSLLDDRRTLIATARCSRVSYARYTMPIPPLPRSDSTRYWASIVPTMTGTEVPANDLDSMSGRSDRARVLLLLAEALVECVCANGWSCREPPRDTQIEAVGQGVGIGAGKGVDDRSEQVDRGAHRELSAAAGLQEVRARDLIVVRDLRRRQTEWKPAKQVDSAV